jgi:broad specificity phosphatase PhoE
MGWPKLLVVVRHAESEGNVRTFDERVQMPVSNFRFKLTKRGKQQAAISGEYVREKFGEFDGYFTSYYERAKETFKIMFPDVCAIEDARLCESQRGILHNLSADQVAAIFPDEAARLAKEGLYHCRPIGGENWLDVELRIHSFIEMLRQDYQDQRVLIVAHGQWLFLLQKVLEQTSMEEALAAYKPELYGNASVTSYVPKSDKGRLRLRIEDFNFVPWHDRLK